jgi:mannose-1-phosphate guanylyltransferase
VTLPAGTGTAAIILSGGFGTRLGPLTADLPKPMLPVGGRPFVEYLVIGLARAGFTDIVFATGYRSAALVDHFGTGDRWGVLIRYSHEREPLGTGGGIRLAAQAANGDPLLVLNGDSYLDCDLRLVVGALHDDMALSMALTRVADGRRFGRVERATDGRVIGFSQASEQPGPATINAGIYAIHRRTIDALPPGRPVSLEREVLPGLINSGLTGVMSDGYFVDIGIPEAYLGLLADPDPLLRSVGVEAVG